MPNLQHHSTEGKTRIRSESTNLHRTRHDIISEQYGGSGFRTLDSRIRSVIRIATKIVSFGPWAMPYPYKKISSKSVHKFASNPMDRQTNRPNQKHNLLLRRR